jgi:dethiobiotin synthetase
MIVKTLNENESVVIEGKGSVYIPYSTQYGFISDIDERTITISPEKKSVTAI